MTAPTLAALPGDLRRALPGTDSLARMESTPALLDGPRARHAFLLKVLMSPPWSIDVADGAPLTFVVVLRGHTWFSRPGEPLVEVATGDLLLVRGDEPYVLSSGPDLPPTVHVGEGQQCSGPGGRDLSDECVDGLLTWGNDAQGEDVLLVGTLRTAAEVGAALLSRLPGSVVVRATDTTLVEVLAAEMATSGPAQTELLDRLVDVVLLRAVRGWAGLEIASGSRSRTRDPVVDEALALIHDAPDRPWTVQSLAARVNVSRASFARRFADATGTPPILYLTRWRLALAAELLADPTLTLTAISRRVGYSTPFSFSAAFKKFTGVSPQAYRSG